MAMMAEKGVDNGSSGKRAAFGAAPFGGAAGASDCVISGREVEERRSVTVGVTAMTGLSEDSI